MASANKDQNKTSESVLERKQKLKQTYENMQSSFAELNIEEELERFKEIECGSCGTNLGLENEDLSDMLREGSHNQIFECPNCSMLNNLEVIYNEAAKDGGTAIINLEVIDYAYIKKSPLLLNDEDLFKRLRKMAEDIQSGRRRQPPELTMLILITNYLDTELQSLKTEYNALIEQLTKAKSKKQ